MVDYRINLAKTLASTPEQRRKFYHGMLIYLVVCSAAMVYVAYLSSINLKRFLDARWERAQLRATAASVAGLDASAFKNPDKTYGDLQAYSGRIVALKTALGERTHLLPIIHNLFADLPDGVVLQSLSADKGKVSFGLAMPPPSEEAGDPVRKLKTAWEKNEELMKSVASIRPLTGERRTSGEVSVFHVQFECVLKK